jgi:enoyl-CoA hydratase
MSDTEPAVLVDVDGHVATVTLNRPEKRNAFNPEMLCRLADAWDMIDADDAIRVAILTGAGGNFSAGADLDRLVSAMIKGLPPENEFEERVRDDYSIIFKGFLKEHRLRTPLIAAIEGYCYAGGTEILQATDIRVAAETAQIAISEVQRGLFPMGGSTIRLRRQIAYVDAMELLLCGDPITGARAAEIRLVNYAVRENGALDKARELADRIAANGPLAVRAIKEAVVETEFVAEKDAFALEMPLGMTAMNSNDAKEGAKAFLEKRPAEFTGT